MVKVDERNKRGGNGMSTYKVIVAGSREFTDYEKLRTTLDRLLSRYEISEIEIVSGGARGADTLGERYAEEKGCPVHVFPADWEQFGKAAGYRRNVQMAEYADACVAFWDGKSRGTKHMIDISKRYDLDLRVINIGG